MKKLIALVLGGLLAATPNSIRAQSSPALTISGGGFLGANTGTYGWAFSVSAPVTVSALGWFDFGGNGLNAAHDIAIWTGAGVLVVSGTVPLGNANEVNSFNYVAVAPTLLAPGNYVIGGFESGESGDPIIVGASTITPAANITYSGSRSTTSGGGSLAFPSGDQVGNANSYFGPNFLIVPEPGASALLLVGGTASLVTWFRRRRNRATN